MNGQTRAVFASLSASTQYADGLNLYQFVGSNPNTGRDPSGLFVDIWDEVDDIGAHYYADRAATQIEVVQQARHLYRQVAATLNAMAQRLMVESLAAAIWAPAPYAFAAYDTADAFHAMYRHGFSWGGVFGVAASLYGAKQAVDIGASLGIAIRKGQKRSAGLGISPEAGAFRRHLHRSEMNYRQGMHAPRKIKGGPKFPNLKDHARRHSDLHPNAYYNEAVRNLQTGRKFKFTHDGRTKAARITRLGSNRFMFTSASQSGKIIYTHMVVHKQYLRNLGITLPSGF